MKYPLSDPGDAVEAALAAAFVEHSELPAKKGKPRRTLSRRQTFALAIGVFVLLGTVAILVGLWLADQSPDWWKELDPSSAQVRETADAAERAVTVALHQVRESEDPWLTAIGEDAANAWLSARLPRWIENQGGAWPEGWAGPCVRFHADRVSIAFKAVVDGRERFVTLSLYPTLEKDGDLRIRSAGVKVGRLSVPPNVMRDRMRGLLASHFDDEQELARIESAMFDEAPLPFSAAIDLDDGRVVRLLDLRVEEGRLVLTCRTDRTLSRPEEPD